MERLTQKDLIKSVNIQKSKSLRAYQNLKFKTQFTLYFGMSLSATSLFFLTTLAKGVRSLMEEKIVVFRKFGHDESIVALFPEIPFSEDEPYRCKAFYNGEFQAMSYNGVDSYTRKLNNEDREDKEYQRIYDFLTDVMGNLNEVEDYEPPKGKTATEIRSDKLKTREEKMNDIIVLPEPDVEFRNAAIQFGEDDWPGYFMRGDSCAGFVMQIFYILETLTDKRGKYRDEIGIDTAIYLDQLKDLAFEMENNVILTERKSLITSSKRWQYLENKKK